METQNQQNNIPSRVEISHRTIIFTVLFLIGLWLLLQIKEIIYLVFVAFILMSAFKPLVEKLEHFRVPRAMAIFMIYILIVGSLGYVGSSVIPPLISQSIRLGESIPGYIKTVLPLYTLDSQTITQQLTPLGQNIFKVTIGLFSNIVSFFTILVISFYLLIERKHLEFFLGGFMGLEGSKRLLLILHKVEERLGAWVRGQLTLAFVIGFATFIGLTLLDIPYVLPLSISAGILEIVPTIGPIISAIPAILVALTISPIFALIVAALYFLIQQAENHLIVPFVMKTVVGLPPLVTIIALLIGAKLSGIEGALLAVPVVVTVETIIAEYSKLKS
ncbi:hypothetical protein COY59_02380 [Candidatus Gottesmanbacteria bacterium CG_4_10_14_0_8_um_filter_37_24]|uniref:AI-2E family transporter n=1 Tax=Candidatus Gottesmanbacteria bacterium CG_4_10_14_0_8_um_filter_37_24 TaxID=1974574 RepID=A0A2M7RS40_9BACT|nr:MAG: hypothetical protein COX23_04665 [Candidatus Gottesmanbacteria bacterium CG23_combo_of_CG06-09_8_20_14_all_37_19]PIZ02885.1 MAG: hypothetical protein COY59_02380 [Candidatus Gottesmanbacteria bacterium CG_4_10_14_0_8_um_filter_37_24]